VEFIDCDDERQAVYGPRLSIHASFSGEKSTAEHELLRNCLSQLLQMKRTLLALLFPATLLISSSIAQTPDPKEQQLAALIKEVQAQQAQIAENQAKIDAHLADLAETIRVARIFSKREK